MPTVNNLFKEREISWLSFNERVLQEAEDPSVPLIERLKFLGIFSSNLDEFYRVRVAVLKRMSKLSNRYTKMVGKKPEVVLDEIQQIMFRQNKKFNAIYADILQGLSRHHIHIINETQLNQDQVRFVQQYFRSEVHPTLVPIMIDDIKEFPYLKDRSIYLAVILSSHRKHQKNRYALIEVPSQLPRFIVLPDSSQRTSIILLDDIIRYCLHDIFFIFGFNHYSAFTVKMTRDAELDLDNDAVASYVEKLEKSLKQRQKGNPVRFIYDETMPEELLNYFVKRLHLNKKDTVVSGGRYHNFKDFIRFPKVGPSDLRYHYPPVLKHRDLPHGVSVIDTIRHKDIVLHFPYQSFDHVIDLLREAAIDPNVTSIKMTLYRVASKSNVVNALINAVKNGKRVVVVMELQARFDEEANIYWSNRLVEEGAKVIHGFRSTDSDPRDNSYKVHSKLLLITRQEGRHVKRFAAISTGNYNEDTARIYTDKCLLTSHKGITEEVGQLFEAFEDHIKLFKIRYKHLAVSPYNMRSTFVKLIKNEIRNHQEGKPAYIILKVNNLVDKDVVILLNDAVKAGVKVNLIIRGTCSLVPAEKTSTSDFEAISIVDKFLEHSRVYFFCNNNDPVCYISSADLMTRNLDQRIEVAVPIYDKALQQELRTIIDLQLDDTVKARLLDIHQSNIYKVTPAGEKPIRSQESIYEYLKTLSATD